MAYNYIVETDKEHPGERTMKSIYTVAMQNALHYAKDIAISSGQNYIGTEHLLAGLVCEPSGTAGSLLREQGVTEEKLQEHIRRLVTPPVNVMDEMPSNSEYSPRSERMLVASREEMHQFGAEKVGTEHLLLALIRETDCVATRLLHTMNVNIQKLFSEILLAMGEETAAREMTISRNEPTKAMPTLEKYSRDLTLQARNRKLDPVLGRQKEMDRIIQILSRRTKNNPCLIGEPGVGKTAIAEGLAQRIVDGEVPTKMLNKRIVVLDLSSMVAGSKYRGEFEERVKNVVKEVSGNRDILLFIDELHTIIGAGGAEGSLDASNILKPSLSRGEIQLIGATTIEEYRKYIEKDAALERRFQPVMVEEPSEEETILILKGLRPYYEQHHSVEISDEAIEAAVAMSVRYIGDRFLPDKAIDVIDEASSKVQLAGFKKPKRLKELNEELTQILKEREQAIIDGNLLAAKRCQEAQETLKKKIASANERYHKSIDKDSLIVDKEDIAKIVSGWTKIPVQQLEEEETKRLAQLEKVLHKRVIGQEAAVKAVAKAIKRGRVGLKDPNRPIGSFLFLGPTGVGKTELSKALAQAVFGSEQAMIRLDMSEYMEKHSVSKLIGSPPGYVGYDEGGQLSEKVRRSPYSVILFDEIEKAHPDVFNILLQVLDDGHITDSQGRRVDFKHTCIIMTSNAGATAIVEPKRLGFVAGEDEKRDYDNMKSAVMEEVKRIFKPEFLNRIDETIVFHMLSQKEIKQIASLLLKDLRKRCQVQMGIDLRIRESVKTYIATTGYDNKYGARPLRRVIQTKIEDALAEEILASNIKSGDKVAVGINKKAIKFTVTD